jgi:hypothetical protein
MIKGQVIFYGHLAPAQFEHGLNLLICSSSTTTQEIVDLSLNKYKKIYDASS